MDGGFLVKFDGKEAFRCANVNFDYDTFTYKRNGKEEESFPKNGIAKIEIIFEEESFRDR